jgi:glycosyltransferase involved in cell wall biosynthesis
LERRKGIVEFVDAAVRAAAEFPMQHFEFVGADTRTGERGSVRRMLAARIPRALRERFSFHGAHAPDAVKVFLRKARFAAVPSRWDNFPNTCMEAMHSGLPVIGTRTGGIAEMVTEARSGWLAEPDSPEHLLETLRLALGTSRERLAEMGATAARDIRQICDPDRVIADQLELRKAMHYRERREPVLQPR